MKNASRQAANKKVIIVGSCGAVISEWLNWESLLFMYFYCNHVHMYR